MWTDTCHKNDLVHLEAMVIRLEQLLALGDSIAATSLVGQPAYWRGRIGMLLESAGVSTADRELARALLRRLARIPESRGHPMAANERAHTWERT
jgi:hypothetical protein